MAFLLPNECFHPAESSAVSEPVHGHLIHPLHRYFEDDLVRWGVSVMLQGHHKDAFCVACLQPNAPRIGGMDAGRNDNTRNVLRNENKKEIT